MIKIKNVTELKELLRNEGYDKILIWENGEWNLATSGYAGEQDGINPTIILKRVNHIDLTYKQINELVKRLTEQLNM